MARAKKIRVPDRVRREVALRHGAIPGETTTAACAYCGGSGTVHWNRLSSGKPSAWLTFAGLELDHIHPELHGGIATPDNITLACQRCNRSKGHRLGWSTPNGLTPVEAVWNNYGKGAE